MPPDRSSRLAELNDNIALLKQEIAGLKRERRTLLHRVNGLRMAMKSTQDASISAKADLRLLTKSVKREADRLSRLVKPISNRIAHRTHESRLRGALLRRMEGKNYGKEKTL